MAKATPPAAPAQKPASTEAVPSSSKSKAKQKAAAKPKSNGEAPTTGPGKAPTAKKSKAARHEPVVATPSPKVQAEAHETQEKIRELIKLAKEQGYLTWDDLNEALPDGVNDPDLIESIQTRQIGRAHV